MNKKLLKKFARSNVKNKTAPVPVSEVAAVVEVAAEPVREVAPVIEMRTPAPKRTRSLSELIKSELSDYEKRLSEMNAA